MCRWWCGILWLAWSLPVFASSAVDDAEWPALREAFKAAYPHAERGDFESLRPYLLQLTDYPLYPDLYGTYLRAGAIQQDPEVIDAFLRSYPDLEISADLKARWLRTLAERGEWRTYRIQYSQPPQLRDDPTLRCYALEARRQTGATGNLAGDTLSVWLVGKSQPQACDSVFEWLEQTGYLTTELKRKRIDQAIDARQFGLARYLASSLSAEDGARAERWQAMERDAATVLSTAARNGFNDDRETRALTRYGLERLARSEPLEAAALWNAISAQLNYSTQDRAKISRTIALWSARQHLPEAAGLLANLEPRARTTLVAQWQARMGLRNGDWRAVLAAIQSMPQEERNEEDWQYWEGRAREALGQNQRAQILYRQLAAKRHYYGFLAADRLGQTYSLNHEQTQANEQIIAELDLQPDIVRAREFFMVGLYGRGRTEWARATRKLTRAQLQQAAILANRWGWYSRAIAAAVASGLSNDLNMRFPFGFQPLIEHYSAETGLPSAWVYGIARSESLFMPDVASRAGALGLMQLIPATGQSVARQNGVPYSNRFSLLDPDTNVRLGTTYLSSLYERFGNSRVLASAAYNAGPHRVDAWLPHTDALPADLWIDTIPFGETRSYVRNVLAAQVVFYWRETGRALPLTQVMTPVQSSEKPVLAGVESEADVAP